mmetsp:Transcript_11286/g.10920  ORF Transcript_11286/g.10920 Transcript_11286/m.10920 type:complete len:298 (-) Transcript_11286:2306-3199(-)
MFSRQLLFIFIIAIYSVSSKSFRGFQIRQITSNVRNFNFPLKPLFSSEIGGDGGGNGVIVGNGNGNRGGVGGGDGSNGNIVGNGGSGSSGGDGDIKQSGTLIMLFKSLLDSYGKLLEISPIKTKIVTSAIIGALGDSIIQMYESTKTKKRFNFRRLVVFSTVTGLYIAPFLHVWLDYLNVLPFLSKLGNFQKAFSMLLIDQTIGAIAINIGFFFAFEASEALYPPYSEKSKHFLRTGWEATKENFGVAIIANWYYWPFISFANFLLIPLQYRVLFCNGAAIFWNIFMSSVVNNKKVA